ncbi:MAG: hypothetical protein U0441_23320 [Polyangiaceae bacterium]
MQRNGLVVRVQVEDEHGGFSEINVVRFKGLLALAHDDGLRAVKTKLLQSPEAGNGMTAIVSARVKTRSGTFTGLGDANPDNVDSKIAPHVIRMAETRALARAFRTAVNIGEVAVEELGTKVRLPRSSGPSEASSSRPSDLPAHGDAWEGDDSRDRPPSKQRPARGAQGRSRGRDEHPEAAEPNDRRRMSDEQRKLLFRLALQLGETADTAESRVRRALGTGRLVDASRAEASRAIDLLKREVTALGTVANGNGAASDVH